MKAGLLFFSAVVIGAGLVWGTATAADLDVADRDLLWAVAIGAGVLSFMAVLPYMSLRAVAEPPEPRSEEERQQALETEHDLQTAELQMGLVFALVGGMMAAGANSPVWMVAAIAIYCASVGGLIGFDVKRRVRRIRAKSAANWEQNVKM